MGAHVPKAHVMVHKILSLMLNKTKNDIMVKRERITNVFCVYLHTSTFKCMAIMIDGVVKYNKHD